MLKASHLSVTKGANKIVTDVSLEVRLGTIIGLLGPNGAGKTTIMHALCGLGACDRLDETTIILDDNNITQHSLVERVHLGLVYLPQQTSLFQLISVQENLQFIRDYHPEWQNKKSDTFWDEALTLLTRVGLKDRLQQLSGTLSGGQKRKLEIVRTLLMHPRIVVCDEPFAGVDPKSISELQELFRETATEQSISIIISDHNVSEILSGSDYIYMMFNGSILAQGTAQEIVRDPQTQQRYFGERFSKQAHQHIDSQ